MPAGELLDGIAEYFKDSYRQHRNKLYVPSPIAACKAAISRPNENGKGNGECSVFAHEWVVCMLLSGSLLHLLNPMVAYLSSPGSRLKRLLPICKSRHEPIGVRDLLRVLERFFKILGN